MKWFFKRTKIKIFILSEVLLLLAIGTFAVFAMTENSGDLVPKNLNPKDQFLEVTSSNPINGQSSSGAPNKNIVCDSPQQQLIGIIESNRGGGQNPARTARPQPSINIYNYKYIPVCTDVDWFTFECTSTGWAQQYNSQDTLTVICATNTLKWEDINEKPNLPSSSDKVIGASP